MDDFFKQLKDNLENRAEPASEERDWQDLQKRLDQHEKKRPAGFAWWWWLALPLLLLLLGLNGAFFWELRKANQKIYTLEIQSDTIYKTQVIYQRDTIYKTRVIRETVIAYRTIDLTSTTAYFGTKNGGLKTTDKEKKNAIILKDITSESNGLNSITTPNVTSQSLDYSNYKGIAENKMLLTDFDKIRKLDYDSLTIPSRDLPKMSDEPVVKKSKKTLPQHLYTLRPKAFQLGIHGGGTFPFSKEVKPIAGYSAGLQGIIEFSPSLQLWADATYVKTSFETDRIDATIGVPLVEPPSDDFTFLLAEVPQPSLQFSVGMQSFFNTKGKIQPFIGAGIGAVSLLPHEIIYEFKDQTLGIEWSIDKGVPRSETLANFWMARAGLAYKISEHLQGQFTGMYRGNWKGTKAQFPQVLGIQAGLNYRF